MMLKRIASLGFGLALLITPASAGDTQIGDIVVSNVWTRVTPPGAKVAGGFMTITNKGKTADRLVGGTAPIAGRIEVHEMTMEGGAMKMQEVAGGLEIKPGETVELKPGSYHVMFMDLKAGPVEGTPIEGTLKFDKAGETKVNYKVAPLGAKTANSKGGDAKMHEGAHGKHH